MPLVGRKQYRLKSVPLQRMDFCIGTDELWQWRSKCSDNVHVAAAAVRRSTTGHCARATKNKPYSRALQVIVGNATVHASSLASNMRHIVMLLVEVPQDGPSPRRRAVMGTGLDTAEYSNLAPFQSMTHKVTARVAATSALEGTVKGTLKGRELHR